MPQPATGSTEGETFPAVCGHTHLFPGARCRLQGLPDPRAFAADPWPIGVDLRFSDVVGAEAELRTDDLAGPVLAVPAYTTGAGTKIEGRTWLVRGVALEGDEVELTIGSRAVA
ncbi:hypothetical protein [Streptomyces zagrosensis]|uniref:Uncharacterized protein n=1 Tax=Streptomyces zagrosensis TaxID=1042984 RepID=A0A7W9QI01_9ACTN|nr:hypothetical protein [Streptomyces zagrosensis]MBB5940339.1 hypothetical protein [Streptomyces zagrosensis]